MVCFEVLSCAQTSEWFGISFSQVSTKIWTAVLSEVFSEGSDQKQLRAHFGRTWGVELTSVCWRVTLFRDALMRRHFGLQRSDENLFLLVPQHGFSQHDQILLVKKQKLRILLKIMKNKTFPLDKGKIKPMPINSFQGKTFLATYCQSLPFRPPNGWPQTVWGDPCLNSPNPQSPLNRYKNRGDNCLWGVKRSRANRKI